MSYIYDDRNKDPNFYQVEEIFSNEEVVVGKVKVYESYATVLIDKKSKRVASNALLSDSYLWMKNDKKLKNVAGRIFTIDQFAEMCSDGSITDDDGSGFFAVKDFETDIRVNPNNFFESVFVNEYKNKYDFVVWYNK